MSKSFVLFVLIYITPSSTSHKKALKESSKKSHQIHKTQHWHLSAACYLACYPSHFLTWIFQNASLTSGQLSTLLTVWMHFPLSHDVLHLYLDSTLSLCFSKEFQAQEPVGYQPAHSLSAGFCEERNSCAFPACHNSAPAFWVRWMDGGMSEWK